MNRHVPSPVFGTRDCLGRVYKAQPVPFHRYTALQMHAWHPVAVWLLIGQ